MSYESQIKAIKEPSFEAIRNVASNEILQLDKAKRDKLWNELKRGTAQLQTDEHMCQYLYSFGNMHQAKLLHAYKQLPTEFFKNEIEVFDWGCGQAMGSIVFFDFIKKNHPSTQVKKITLIEPAAEALKRGGLHIRAYSKDIELVKINSYFDQIKPKAINVSGNRTVIHIFSNILDVVAIDLKQLASLIDGAVVSDNYLLCVGPLNPTNQRIDAFFRYFNEAEIKNLYEFQTANFHDRGWTYKARIYKLEKNEKGHLIPIKYYPTVQFHAAYELDIVRAYRRSENLNWGSLNYFEVAAPFDLGASVYDDVHPILAVLNNVICRGLPTRTSPFIEDAFSQAFGLSEKTIENGEINYHLATGGHLKLNKELALKYLDKKDKIPATDLISLQLLLTPIAIARFQKVLLEAIITGKLPIKSKQWNILIEEKDVPFAHLALEDFKHLFNHLVSLSDEYKKYSLPDIDLHIVSNPTFYASTLQPEGIYETASPALKRTTFDMVVTHAVLKTTASDIESFSEYIVNNNCYFNIRSGTTKKTNRVIYTSSLIKYNHIVNKDRQGNYTEIPEAKSDLLYFLQILFRKEDFRPGQLPILDRALQNLPVIGLLPTGGGKSITYQISALLQPGIAMVIDPLKSLMKDQYDGLINNGIDSAAFINSTLSKVERAEKERQLEASELQFVFLSPERLAIASFRERLKNMHNYNVYFSYGVIDEVHCVSEWGHDFRFSYLHLGRNLYNYVRAKKKEISLFGLTATASFDVLADVERELSGNGSFLLDADVIVRHENTNRLELQYKIEKVEVEFEVDQFYDKNKHMPPHLPKAINATNYWSAYDSKANYLKGYYKQIPTYLKLLQLSNNIDLIKKRFNERQNIEIIADRDLTTFISSDPFTKRKEYKEAGIVFCSHVDSTGISVSANTSNLKNEGVTDIASFSGKDDDNSSMLNLEQFRNNRSPIMVATKAFGMGIDKPNVRFTVNMNYSSSLESFVQEAGRAGRDQKIALSTILVSDYTLAQVSQNYQENTFPIGIIRNKWFKKEDLLQILSHYNLRIPEQYILTATPSKDIAKLYCTVNNKMFAFEECDASCSEFNRCNLKKVKSQTRGWKAEIDLIQELSAQNLSISKKNFQYANPDYAAVMYFFNESFKGDLIEKRFMHQLLNTANVFISTNGTDNEKTEKEGFLSTLRQCKLKESIVVYIPYRNEDYADLSKAIYRMTCLELIEDFTQDYTIKQFRIVASKKKKGEYFNGLRRFLKRYYTDERADTEIEKVKQIPLKGEKIDVLDAEIYRCLSYLTEFVYDKISVKRKRAIDDMRNFCMEGLDDSISWVERNENLKDFIYYYFNSKYAKSDYIADNGAPYSLVQDTDGGKISSEKILFKYLKVTDDDIVGFGTPLDNVRHLHGAVRLISRSLTDSNPALYLLEVFCLSYIGMKNNKNLEEQLISRYTEGMLEFYQRITKKREFWLLFKVFNEELKKHLKEDEYNTLVDETSFLIHSNHLQSIKQTFLEAYE